MKVKMIEHYRDAKQHLAIEQEVEVGGVLGAWLIEHGKAKAIESNAGSIHDVEPQFENANIPPKPKKAKPKVKKPRKSGRGAK